MRSLLSDGHPEDPLIIYVGRLGAEKRLRDLRGVLERWVCLPVPSVLTPLYAALPRHDPGMQDVYRTLSRTCIGEPIKVTVQFRPRYS